MGEGIIKLKGLTLSLFNCLWRGSTNLKVARLNSRQSERALRHVAFRKKSLPPSLLSYRTTEVIPLPVAIACSRGLPYKCRGDKWSSNRS